MALAMATRRRCPPESERGFRSSSPLTPERPTLPSKPSASSSSIGTDSDSSARTVMWGVSERAGSCDSHDTVSAR